MDRAGGVEERVAKRLNYLFASVFPRNGSPRTNEEVSLAIGVPTEDIADLRAGEPLPDITSAKLFQCRLKHLIATRLKPRTMTDLAKACGKSRPWLYNLLAEESPASPTLEAAVLLGRFFGVGPAFFTNDPLQALSGHFGVEAGAKFFTDPDDSPAVADTLQQIELAVMLREAGGSPAVLGRILGGFPEARGGGPRKHI